MNKRYKSIGLLLVSLLFLVTLGIGCKTHVGLGFGFGGGGSSVSLEVSSAIPQDTIVIWETC